MCNPLLAMVAIQAASSAAQYEGQRRSASMQTDAIKAGAAENDNALLIQQDQLNTQASQEISERALQAQRERGRIAAIFADSGGGGVSDGRVLTETEMDFSRDAATIEANRSQRTTQIQNQRRSGVMQANNQLAAIERPSLLGAGLKIASTAVGGYVQMGGMGKFGS